MASNEINASTPLFVVRDLLNPCAGSIPFGSEELHGGSGPYESEESESEPRRQRESRPAVAGQSAGHARKSQQSHGSGESGEYWKWERTGSAVPRSGS